MPKLNLSAGATGALAGAGTGAAIGSAVPFIGTAIGAGVGGLAGGAAGLFDRPAKDRVKKVPLQTPEQQQLSQLINQGLIEGTGPFSDLVGGFNEQQFQQGVRDPALKQFREQIIPQLQEKYIARGQTGGSGQRRAELRAATDLQSNLSQLQYQARQDQLKNKLQGIQTSLNTRAFEPLYQQGSPSTFSQAAGAAAPQAGNALGSYLASLSKNQQQGISAQPPSPQVQVG